MKGFAPCYVPPVAKNVKIPKTRADLALVERGLAESRSRAQALILAGLVFTGEKRVEKAGDTLSADAPLELQTRAAAAAAAAGDQGQSGQRELRRVPL